MGRGHGPAANPHRPHGLNPNRGVFVATRALRLVVACAQRFENPNCTVGANTARTPLAIHRHRSLDAHERSHFAAALGRPRPEFETHHLASAFELRLGHALYQQLAIENRGRQMRLPIGERVHAALPAAFWAVAYRYTPRLSVLHTHLSEPFLSMCLQLDVSGTG